MDGPMVMDDTMLSELSNMLQVHASGSPLRSHVSTPRSVLDDPSVANVVRTPEGAGQLFTENEASLLSQFLANLENGLAQPLDGSAPSASLSSPPRAASPHTGQPEAPTAEQRGAPPAEERGAPLTALPPVPERTNVSEERISASDAPEEPPQKRRRHIVSEQRRRNQIREGFMRLSELLDTGRLYGARALGLNAGAGTGVEDEDLDDRTDNEEDLSLVFDEEEAQRRRRNAQRRARSRVVGGKTVRGRGRGRGGSAGGSGSKSAVLFQVIDLLYWLDARNTTLRNEIAELSAAV